MNGWYSNATMCNAMARASLLPSVAEMPDDAERRRLRNEMKRRRKKARR